MYTAHEAVKSCVMMSFGCQGHDVNHMAYSGETLTVDSVPLAHKANYSDV